MNFTFRLNNVLKSVVMAGVVAGVGLVGEYNGLTAQDGAPIEIINQDGKQVKSVEVAAPEAQSEARSSAQAGARAGAQTSGQAQAGGQIGGRAQDGGQIGGQARGGISVQNKDGKITIIDGDGNKREIDVQGAQSITVRQGEKTIVENGQEKRQIFGKAIIVGPDGKRQEIEIGDPGAMGIVKFPGLRGAMRATRVDNKFAIGVNCDPVNELLASQLNLEIGIGLVVRSVNNDSPAAKAGIQKHDILMFADDRQLAKVTDLTEVIQTAGKEKSKISFTAIRGGKEVGIEVSPVERPANQPMGGGPQLLRVFPELNGNFDLQMRHALPGVIIDRDFAPDFKDFDKRMKDQMDEMRAQMDQMRKEMDEQLNNGGK